MARGKRISIGKSGGQTVDVSIMERLEPYFVFINDSLLFVPFSMLNLMEGIVPEYSRKNKIRGPSGSSITGIVPTNAYPTSEASAFIVIGANADNMYNRLMKAIDRPDLIGSAFAHNPQRVEQQAVIEDAIAAWTRRHTPDEVCAVMDEASVPVGRINNVKDIMENEHVRARGMIETVRVDKGDGEGWDVEMSRVFPRLDGGVPTRWAGPDLGQHNEEVFTGILGLSLDDLARLAEGGVIDASPTHVRT